VRAERARAGAPRGRDPRRPGRVGARPGRQHPRVDLRIARRPAARSGLRSQRSAKPLSTSATSTFALPPRWVMKTSPAARILSRMTRMGVIGSAVVGQTLAAGLKKHGYDVRIASRAPEKLAEFSAKHGIPAGSPAEVAAWAEAAVLAVKG